MIKLLIVVFSFFCIVGIGYTAESEKNATKSQNGCTSCGINAVWANSDTHKQSSSKTTSSNGVTAETKAAAAVDKAKWLISADTMAVDEEAKLANELNSEWDANRKSIEKKTEQSNNILGLSDSDLRTGNVNQNTIATVIVNIINLLLGVAGTVAIFSLIYHAVQMQINSGITGDSSGVDKAKKWMIGALIGFVIAISAWFLVARVVELLGAAS